MLNKAHEGFHPMECGFSYNSEQDKSVIFSLTSELTEEEKKSFFAKYYNLDPCGPDDTVVVALQPGKMIDASQAFCRTCTLKICCISDITRLNEATA